MRILTLACAAFCALSTPALAENNNLFIAGGEAGGNRSNYGMVGVITPLQGTLGNGIVGHIFLNGLTYRYEKNATTEIDGDGFGGEAVVGVQRSGAWGWWGFYAGPGYQYTDLSPNDPDSDADGSDWTMRLITEGDYNVTPNAKLGVNAIYSAFGNNDFWTRLRGMARIKQDIFAGPEFTWQGNNDYRAYGIGAAVTGISLTPQSNIGFKAGVKKVEDLSFSPYVGVEYGTMF